MTPDQKKTNIGAIPKDWDVKTLGEIASIDSENLSNSTPGDFTFNYISLEDVENGILKSHSEQKFSKAPSRARRVLKNKDILLSTVRPNLQSHLLFEEKKGNWVCSTGFSTIRCTENAIFPEYIFHHLFHSQITRQISNLLSGSNYPAINSRDVKSLSIPIPKYEEQRSIATSLSDIDALLESLNSLIAKKRAIKQATMQQLLSGKTRLAGHTHPWKSVKLGDITHIKTGSRNNEDKCSGGAYPFFVRSEFVERIDTYSHDCEAILVPGEGRIGDVYHYVNGKFDVHQRVYAITQFSADAHAKYVYLYMKNRFGSWALKNTVKATVDSLRLPTFQDFEIQLPSSIDEQKAIAAIINDKENELKAIEARLVKYQSLKQAMMQELLNGRTRLI